MCRDGSISLFHFYFFIFLVLSFGEYVGWGRLGIFTNGFAGYGIWRNRQLIGRVGFGDCVFCYIFLIPNFASHCPPFFMSKLLLTVFFCFSLYTLLLQELFALICVFKHSRTALGSLYSLYPTMAGPELDVSTWGFPSIPFLFTPVFPLTSVFSIPPNYPRPFLSLALYFLTHL